MQLMHDFAKLERIELRGEVGVEQVSGHARTSFLFAPLNVISDGPT